MSFFSQQLSPEKWGIYNDAGLIATVSCQATCETILANLKSGRRDTPASALSELYKVPKLKSKPAAGEQLALNNGRRSNRPPVPRRKTRKSKASKTKTKQSNSQVASQAASQLSSTPAIAESTPETKTKVAAETPTEVRVTRKVSDFANLQQRQITVAKATGTSGQSPSVGNAERA